MRVRNRKGRQLVGNIEIKIKRAAEDGESGKINWTMTVGACHIVELQ